MASSHDDGDHASCDPDGCMSAKLRYWREGGNPALFQYTFGKASFHGPTIKERQDKIIADAKREGRDVRLVNPTYDRVGV